QLLKQDEEVFMKAVRESVRPFLVPAVELDSTMERAIKKLPKEKGLALREYFKDKALEELLSSGAEPVGDLAKRYVADLDISAVASELGYEKPDEFKGALKGNEKLRELGLAGLLRGGKLKRADWDKLDGRSLYQRVSLALGIASPWKER